MKVLFEHPITHDGVEYGRGVHELDSALATLFIEKAPYAAKPYDPKKLEPAMGEKSDAPDAKTVKVATGADLKEETESAGEPGSRKKK